jgi:hypothetical protein
MHHHHHAEETVLFPSLESLTQNPEIMHENKEQHEAFLTGMNEFGRYVKETGAESWEWDEAKGRLDAFAEALVGHLRDEIPTLMGLREYDSGELRKVWQKMEDAAKGDIMLPGMFVSSTPTLLPNSAEQI